MAHRISPNEIANMTLAQIYVYHMESSDPGADGKCSISELPALQAKIKFQRDWWKQHARATLGLG